MLLVWNNCESASVSESESDESSEEDDQADEQSDAADGKYGAGAAFRLVCWYFNSSTGSPSGLLILRNTSALPSPVAEGDSRSVLLPLACLKLIRSATRSLVRYRMLRALPLWLPLSFRLAGYTADAAAPIFVRI